MTDKTIINGVDVSGCEFRQNEGLNPITLKYEKYETRCRAYEGFCKEYPNCSFKQSAHKDERIRELEQRLSQIAELVNEETIKIRYYDYNDRSCLFKLLQQIKQIAQGE